MNALWSLKYKLFYFFARCSYLSDRHINSLSTNQVSPNYSHFSEVKSLAFTTTKSYNCGHKTSSNITEDVLPVSLLPTEYFSLWKQFTCTTFTATRTHWINTVKEPDITSSAEMILLKNLLQEFKLHLLK